MKLTMKTKYLLIIMFLVCISLLFVSCGEEESEMDFLEEAFQVQGFVADNSTPLSAVLTQEYSLQELRDFFGYRFSNEVDYHNENDLSINGVHARFPIECLRSGDGFSYTVYKVREGGYFYVFWVLTSDPFASKESESEPGAAVYFAAYIEKGMQASDFDSLKEGVSTAEDVAQIDPAFEMMLLMSHATYSYSLLDDGTIMEIRYQRPKSSNTRDLVIESKSIVDKDKPPSKLASILPEDLPYG